MMWSFISRVVSSTVANRSYIRIWVKYDFHKNYVQFEERSVGVFKMLMGAGMRKTTVYTGNWETIRSEFQPIDPGQYKTFDVPRRFNKVVYLTAISDNNRIIVNAIPKKITRNVVITEDLQYRFGIKDKGKPFIVDDHSDNTAKVESRWQKMISTLKWDTLTSTSKELQKRKNNPLFDATRRGFKRLFRIKR